MASLEYPKLWRTRKGQPQIVTVANAANSLNYREWCYLDASGEVERGIAASTELDSGGQAQFGMVERAVTGSTDTNIPVIVFTEDLELLMPKTTNAGASQVLAESNLGARFEVYNGATRGDVSVSADTASPVVEHVEFYGGHTQTEAFGWSWYRFIEAEVQVGG